MWAAIISHRYQGCFHAKVCCGVIHILGTLKLCINYFLCLLINNYYKALICLTHVCNLKMYDKREIESI